MPAKSPAAVARFRDYQKSFNGERLPNGRTRGTQYQLDLRAKKLETVRKYKSELGCRDCGEADWVVLELHHRDPATKHPRLTRKKNGVIRTGGEYWYHLSYVDIAAELEKCDVLCSNCHKREEHARRTLKTDEGVGVEMGVPAPASLVNKGDRR